MAGNASNLSLFIGWGAIACGVMIFVRSFFVSSMIWLSYGLPILSLGAVCLFMGILLSILSEKMQQINELKQTLTKHRILNPSRQKFDPPHEAHLRGHGGTHGSVEKTLEKNQQMPPEPPPSINSHDHGASAPMHTHQNENAELEDVYDRLLKLRSDVNELIDECEHPES